MIAGKNDQQNFTEMMESIELNKQADIAHPRGQSIYKQKSSEFSEGKLADLVHAALVDLAEVGDSGPVQLSDIDTLRKKTILYLRACEETKSFPSVLGLARCLGYSDRAIRYWKKNHAETDSGKWLQMFSDLCCDVLHQSALKNNANSIIAIFLSKSLYEMQEKSEIVLSPGQQEEDTTPSIEEIRRRYLPESERLALEEQTNY